jgi:hypothetical protein
VNPGRRGGKPATNRLSYGTAFYYVLVVVIKLIVTGRRSDFRFPVAAFRIAQAPPLTAFPPSPVLRPAAKQLTNAMDLSPSRETKSHSATQEIPSLSCNLKVHYRVRKSPPLVPILTQTNPVRTTPSHFSKTHFNIILHLRIYFCSGLFASGFPTKTLRAFLLAAMHVATENDFKAIKKVYIHTERAGITITFLTLVWKVLGSNSGRDTTCPD